MSQNCNLVSEFNGLVSKRVNRQDWPFLLLYASKLIEDFYFHFFYWFQSTYNTVLFFIENYFLIKQDRDVVENLTLFYE